MNRTCWSIAKKGESHVAEMPTVVNDMLYANNHKIDGLVKSIFA